MGNSTFSFFLAAVLLSNLPAQERDDPDQVPLSSKFAETMLIHKEEPACQKDLDGLRVRGTVILAITIGRDGKVIDAHTLSGPKILRPLALATVRKYRYKPYLLNGTPIEVGTTVSIPMDCFFHTGQA
jgi:protein TonB